MPQTKPLRTSFSSHCFITFKNTSGKTKVLDTCHGTLSREGIVVLDDSPRAFSLFKHQSIDTGTIPFPLKKFLFLPLTPPKNLQKEWRGIAQSITLQQVGSNPIFLCKPVSWLARGQPAKSLHFYAALVINSLLSSFRHPRESSRLEVKRRIRLVVL